MVGFDDRSRPRRWTRLAALASVVLVGVAIRLALLLQWPQRLTVDETIPTLMGLHILRGEFPAFWYLIAYQGTMEAYLTALVYAAVGVSLLTGKLAVFGFSCLLIVIAFLTGRWVAGWPGGLLSALLVALSPPLLPIYGNYAMMGYMEVVVIGSLILLLTLQLVTGQPEGRRRGRQLLVLGLLAGLGWWINPMILSYLAAAGLFLVVSVRFWSPQVVWLPLGFFLGSLPSWIFNAKNDFWTFVLFRRGAAGDFWLGLGRVFRLSLEIAGVRGVLVDPVPVLSAAAGAVYLVLLAILLWDLTRRTSGEESAGVRRRRGVLLLLLFALCHLLASSLSGQVVFTNRHLFPLYSAIPILTGLALLRLWRWSRLLAIASLLLVLLNNGLALAKTAGYFEHARQVDWWRPEPLVAFLQAEGLTRVYAPERIAGRLTLQTQERIVATDPLAERYRPYLEWVDAAPRIAYVTSPRVELTPTRLEASLAAIGARYRRQDVGEFAVFYDFQPPAGEPLASLRPSQWQATSDPPGSGVARAFDRDADTAWLSEAFIRPGMWYRVDLGATTVVAGLTVLPVRPGIGVPAGYRIEVSPDGRGWDAVAVVPDLEFTLRWRDGQPRMEDGGRIVTRFAPRPVRHLRITQTGANPAEWWGIAELFVYEAGPEGVPAGREAATRLAEGRRHEQAGEWGAALARYERAVGLDPELEAAHWAMVNVYARAGLPIAGSDPYRRGLVFEALGQWTRAVRQYEALVEGTAAADGQHSEPLRRLRDLYQQHGAPAAAERLAHRLADEYAPPVRAEARFGRVVRLLGYGLEPPAPRAGDELALAYYWQALAPAAENLAVFVHFVRDGEIRFQQDHQPLDGRHPTSRWVAGELVRERARIRLPRTLPAGEYAIEVGLWNPRTGKRLPVETALSHANDQVRLTTLRVRTAP
jgi:hypothetical protein